MSNVEKMRAKRSEDYEAHLFERGNLPELLIDDGDVLEHDAGELLAYVHGLVGACRQIWERATPAESSAVLGFMTGSADLLWVFRERLGLQFPNRIRLSRGLAHKSDAEDRRPDDELFGILDAWREADVSKLVVVDEVVGGGQARTAMLRLKDWCAHRKHRLDVTLVGMTEKDADQQVELWVNVLDEIEDELIHPDVAFVRVPVLLAKDGSGRLIKPATKIQSNYYPVRAWRGAYRVRCKNTLSGCPLRQVASSHSVGQAFSGTVREVLGVSSTHKNTWPHQPCQECSALIDDIRRDFCALPNPMEDAVEKQRTEGRIILDPRK